MIFVTRDKADDKADESGNSGSLICREDSFEVKSVELIASAVGPWKSPNELSLHYHVTIDCCLQSSF
jgi:hypothetical protein